MPLEKTFFKNCATVRYEAVCDQLCSGDLFFCSGYGPFSRSVRIASDSIWSHVGILVRSDDALRVMVLECVARRGVGMVPLSSYVKNYHGRGFGYTGRIAIARHATLFARPEKERKELFLALSKKYDGCRFDWNTMRRALASRILAPRPRVGPSRPVIQTSFTCAEFVAHCLRAAGLPAPIADGGGFVFPVHIAADPHVEGWGALSVERPRLLPFSNRCKPQAEPAA